LRRSCGGFWVRSFLPKTRLEFAQSRKDFLSKYMIALKEADETRYWINLIIDNELASKNKFTLMLEELDIIIKILISTTKKLKE
jgi:four helix bundle protein